MRDKAPQDVATIHLESDDQISVETDCFHPFARQVLKWKIIGRGGLQTLDGFTIPKQIVYLWNGKTGPGYPESYTVVKVEANPDIPTDYFTLK